MISLSDHQLDVVMGAAGTVPVERRDIFLQRVGAMLNLRGRFTDADVHDVATLAMCGLVPTSAAIDFGIKYWPSQSR
jgi:hypothetical protein